jgi:hypothetical protein
MGLSRFVPKARLAELWGHGFVDVRLLKSKRTGYRQNGADVARYLTKYLVKGASEVEKGKRRFSGSHNLVDTVIELRFETFGEADRFVRILFVVRWELHLSPENCEGWRGPPCWLYR